VITQFDQLVVDGLIEGGNTSIYRNSANHFLTSFDYVGIRVFY
jgi:hypothetical protein